MESHGKLFFSRQEEMNVLHLFKHFCNNLYLSQWEIAEACIHHLHRLQTNSDVNIGVLLKNITENPLDSSLKSASIKTPYHLSWLCLQVALGADPHQNDWSQKIKRKIEFNMLLLDVCNDADPRIIEDLYTSHGRFIDEEYTASLELQVYTKAFLIKKIYEQPEDGHLLVTSLMNNTDQAYITVYTECLLKIIANFSTQHSEGDGKFLDKKLYEVLALFDPNPNCEVESVEQVFKSLFSIMQLNQTQLSMEGIMSALCRKNNQYLIDLIGKLEYQNNMSSLSTSKSVSELGFDSGALLSGCEKDIFQLLSWQDKAEMWKTVFIHCFKHNQSFLEVVLNTAFSLIKAGDYEQLQELFGHHEIAILKPMVLLLGWNFCYSCAHAKNLLQVLWDNKDLKRSKLLHQACKKLTYQVDLVQWCLEKARPLLVASGAPTTRHDRATEMFQGLETHSLLYVLQHATQLSSLEPSEVLDILQKRPQDEYSGSQTRQKSVHFAESTLPPPVLKNSLSLEQERDISIYYSYCAMKCFMDAIYFCADSANITTQRRKSDLDPTDENPIDDCQTVYQRMVLDKINLGKEYLSKIYPITYRVEMLENIFSLLFVTHEDIQEIAFMPHSDSENELFDHDDVISKAPSLEQSLQSADISITGTEAESSLQANEIEDIVIKLNTLKHRTSLPDINQEMITSLGSDTNSIRYDEPFVEIDPSQGIEMTNDERLLAIEPMRKISSFGFYSITKKGLKDMSGSEAKVSQSGELSTASTATSSLSKLGFIANDYVVRDVLAALKDCAIETGGAKFGLLHTDPNETSRTTMKSDVEKELTKCMKCAISEDELQSRTSQFTQFVSEALWRFQLIIGDDPVLSQPEKVHPDFLANHRHRGFSNDDHVSDLLKDSDDECDASAPNRRKIRRSDTDKIAVEKGRGSSVSGRDSESQNPDNMSKRSKKRRQSPASVKYSNKRQGVISKMLASKETLLNMCLRRGHFAQANQVIKFFGMDDVSQAKEMEFAVQYQGAVRRLQAMDPRRRQTSPAVFSKSRPAVTKINLHAIRTVAAAAEASTLIGSIADEVLSSSSLPIIPDSALTKLESQSLNSEFHLHVNSSHIPAMIVLDLASTACRTWDACESLLDLAYKRLPEIHVNTSTNVQADVKKTRNADNSIIGIGGFLSEMRGIIALGSCESSVINSETWTNLAKCSLHHLLTNVVVPLNVTSCQQYISVLIDIEKSLVHVNKAFKEVDKISDQVFIETIIKKGEKQKPLPTDRPIVHIAVKRLMQVLEKHVTYNGILQHFEGPSDEENGSINLIQSLYDHVKVLAFLEAECQTRPKETILQPYNYFRMLNDSPTTILGKLMFVRKISPYKLEKVAQKLNLNLTKIIVNSCCPDICCKSPGLKKQTGVCQERVVLNSCDEWNGSVRHPEVVVRELLTKLITVMKAEAKKANCTCSFDEAVARILLQSNEVWDILYCCGELKFVDLTLLENNLQKKCFYGNLLNLMNIHTFLYLIDKECLLKNDPVKSMHKTLDKLIISSNISYCVGQLGCISQFELQYSICREGLLPPGSMEKILPDRLHCLDSNDPWTKYGPPAEPRLLFVTTSCTISSPPVQVLTPELVKNQLETAMRTYLERNVAVDEDERQVTLPQMLVWYRYDFVGEKGDQYVADYEGLVNFVVAHTSDEFSEPLRSLLDLDSVHEYSENIDTSGKKELPFKVRIEPYRYGDCVTFASESREHSTLLKTHRRSFSLPSNVKKDVDTATTNTPDAKEIYNLRAITLEYLKAKSALVATLISLVCSDEIDGIEDQMDEKFFDSQSSEDSEHLRKGMYSRRRTDSDMSIVDVRSYRYQRVVDDFPSLHQYLLAYVVPIAAAKMPEILKSSDPVLRLLSTSIDESIRQSMFSMHNGNTFKSDLESTINGLIENRKWDIVIHVLNSIPLITMQKNPHWLKIKDFAICCVVSSEQYKRKDNIWQYMRQASDSNVQTRAVLGTLKFWPVGICIELLSMCRSLPELADELQNGIAQKLSCMKVYEKITTCAKSQQIKISMQKSESLALDDVEGQTLNIDELERLTTWQSVVTVSNETPEKIIELLSRCKEFVTARKWAEIHNIPATYRQTIEENRILNMLEENNSDVLSACASLEELFKGDPDMSQRLCENILLRLRCEKSILLVAQFILKHLKPMLSTKRIEELNLLCLGAKALQALPNVHKSDYHHLVTSPTLLFEQLLMNMRVEWAAKALRLIKPDLELIRECKVSEFDNVVIVYSTKALEFSVIQATDEDVKQRTIELPSNSSSQLSQNLDLATECSPSKFRRKSLAQRRASVAGPAFSVSPSSYNKSASPLARYLLQSAPIPFVMPPEPPAKIKWVPDGSVAECMVCQQERFSMFNRRHHCRRCGRVVCASCSSRTTMIRGISSRTCDDCYEQIFKPRQLTDSEILQQKMKERLSGNKLSPVGSSATTPPALGSISERSSDTVSVNQLALGDMTWKLETDESLNTALRDEFYYEQAPSTSLCISLLHLHSNPNECGQHMLTLCDDLSKILKPIAPGVANPEVDYTLVISMMKYLLFNAKLKFMECNDNSGLDQCEQFKGKVDLLSLLVSANCQDIPSILELTKIDAVRRLRDRLIEDERLTLAMEVSMKNGIEPMGVWIAWGKACLKMGDYPTARAKFARCLKVPNDRHANQMPNKLLCDIVDMIGNHRHQAAGKKAFMAQLKSFNDLIAEPQRLYTGDMNLDDVQFDECLFYLKTYGNYLALVDFLRRHGYLQKALSFILEKKCSGEIFVDGILGPCMKSGELGKFLEQMVMIDPTLDKWHTYLTASCKYLYKMKYTNVLYEFQVFMKDYFRAAMTCINTFYEQGAKSYSDLLLRTNHLITAKQHMEAYLSMNKWSGSKTLGHTSSSSSPMVQRHDIPARLKQSLDEVTKYIETINHQIEITKFLQQNEVRNYDPYTKTNSPSTTMPVPTLFGNSKMKGALIIKIFLSCEDVGEAFKIAIDLMRIYKLNAPLLFTQVCRHFAKDRTTGKIHSLLKQIQKSDLCDEQDYDEIISATMRVLVDVNSEGKEVNNLIKMIKNNANKINAFILCGKLKDAYLCAVKQGSADDVKRIASAAALKGQTAVKSICDSWLEQHYS